MFLVSWILPYAKSLAKEFCFNSTLDTFREALAADTISDSATILITTASLRRDEFWLDILVIVSALLIAILILNCVARCFCWIGIGLPLAARETEQIRTGKRPYQVQAKAEREERQRRLDAGLEEKPVSVMDDLREVSNAVAALRSAQGDSAGGDSLRLPDFGMLGGGAGASLTRRKAPLAQPASSIAGFPKVDFMVASASQTHIVVGCRSKSKTHLFHLGTDAAVLSKGKELQGSRFVSVEASIAAVVTSTTRKPEIYSAAFTPDDTQLVVGERNTDTFFGCSVPIYGSGTPPETLRVLWAVKLPGHRLVSSVAQWSMMDTETMVSLKNQDCEVELIVRPVPASSLLTTPTAVAAVSTEKFKVGSALAWAQCREWIATGGSFLRESRVSKIVRHAGRTGFSLSSVAILPNANKFRVLALSLVTRQTPQFNTRTYLISILENGTLTVYDLESLHDKNYCDTVSVCSDIDYAGYDAAPEKQVRLITAVSGKEYHEILHIGIVRGGSVSVYRQAQSNVVPFEMRHIVDLQDVHGRINQATFAARGAGVITCGVDDDRHVRMFAIPQ